MHAREGAFIGRIALEGQQSAKRPPDHVAEIEQPRERRTTIQIRCDVDFVKARIAEKRRACDQHNEDPHQGPRKQCDTRVPLVDSRKKAEKHLSTLP